MHRTFLYVHGSTQIYEMVQLAHEEHPFSAFQDRHFCFVGYMAAYGTVSPLYCEKSFEVEKPWLQQLKVTGVLGIPNKAGTVVDYPLFGEADDDSEFLVKTPFCRCNILGEPGPMWFLSQLLEASIPFTLAQFPLGFPPPALEDNAFSYGRRSSVADDPSLMNEPSLSTHPTASGDTPLVFEPPRPAPFNVADSLPPFDSILLSAPDSSSLYSASAAHMFSFCHNALFPLPSTGVSDSVTPFEATEELREVAPKSTLPGVRVQLHPDLQWRESIDIWGECDANKRANIALLSGSLWVGLYGNPFKITMVEYRRAITSNFLTALRIEGKTYEEIRDQPLILMDGQTEIAVGWHMFRAQLLGSFEHTRSELRKVIKGAMTPIANFCDASDSGREQEITRYVKLLNSENCPDVQAAISALTDGQAFAELLWTALMMPIGGLADGKKVGRVGDFFHEDICTESAKCLAEDTVCHLLTLFYQTMLLVLKQLLGKERKKELVVYLDHKVMSDVIMAALVPMYQKPCLFPQFINAVTRLPFIQYENVLHFDPKLKLPRTIGKTKISRSMDDVKPITIAAVQDVQKHGLPNNQGFIHYRSFADVFCFADDFKPVMY